MIKKYNSKNNRISKKSAPVKTKPKETSEQKSPEMRINRFLASAGISSRRKAEEFVLDGKVKVNGKVVTDLAFRINPSDNVTVNGDPISLENHFIYILLNKPKDYITTVSDEKGRKSVMDLVQKRARIFPVGRLDRNTTGALLLTNDGELAHRLTHPKYEVERIYNVSVDRHIKPEDVAAIKKGITLDDGSFAKCDIMPDFKDRCKASILIREGKNREVRRIFEHLGYEVTKLDRKMFANISTSGLERGKYRHLTKTEVFRLKKQVGLENR
ncbi:MAG: rRNA synthase [Bacteroidota bacterium]|nr:rRNA synthase [Bacteroidota bacterium]